MKKSQKIDLFELGLVDSNSEYNGTQNIFIDFDGADNISYDNAALGVYTNINSISNSNLSEEVQFQIVTDLNNSFAGIGVSFSSTAPVEEEYSTIYVGGLGSAFSEYGNFLGLSETIDSGNQIKNDEAFVFSDKISSPAAIEEIIAHEAAHLIGYQHVGDDAVDELSDFAAVAALSNNTTKLTATNGLAYACFGYDVAIAGEGATIIVGAYGDDNDEGSVYAYRWNASSSSYDGAIKIVASDADENWFGYAVDGYNDVIISGSGYADGGGGGIADTGAVYVYEWNGSSYTEDKVVAVDGEVGDDFGDSVAISAEIMVVGANGDDNANGTNAGSVYVYHWDGDSYEYQSKIIASSATENDHFGYVVDVSGYNVAVGSNDGVEDELGAYVYRWNGVEYTEHILTVSDEYICCSNGSAIAIDGDVVAVGARCNDIGNGSDSGDVMVYHWNGVDAYEQVVALTASDGTSRDFFGKSVAVSGDYVVVGAYGDDASGVDSGSVYVYRWNGSTYNEFKFSPEDASTLDFYGISVSIDGTRVVVGAYGDDDNGIESGSSYSFDLDDILNKPSNDFDGNHRSDILFSNPTDTYVGYYADGVDTGWNGLGGVTSGWDIVGVGDFDNNGKSDILFSNPTDTYIGYYADGLSTGWTTVGGVSAGWEVVAIGDFDGNAKDDILFSNGSSIGCYTDGVAADWCSLGNYASSWQIEGTGNFDDNGKDDILFSNGTSLGYYADGLVGGWQGLDGISPDWKVESIADFDGNGISDILFSNGTQMGYYADGLASGWTNIGEMPDGYNFETCGDFDGNHRSDILFSSADGTQIGYYADGVVAGWQDLGNVTSGWDIVVA